jgi:hypothetical protein
MNGVSYPCHSQTYEGGTVVFTALIGGIYGRVR